MGNLATLRTPSAIEARNLGAKGGRASAAARRRRRDMREWALALRDIPSEEAPELTNAQAAVLAMYREAGRGNVAAFRELVRVLGEDIDRHEIIRGGGAPPLVLSLVPEAEIEGWKAGRGGGVS